MSQHLGPLHHHHAQSASIYSWTLPLHSTSASNVMTSASDVHRASASRRRVPVARTVAPTAGHAYCASKVSASVNSRVQRSCCARGVLHIVAAQCKPDHSLLHAPSLFPLFRRHHQAPSLSALSPTSDHPILRARTQTHAAWMQKVFGCVVTQCGVA